MLFWLIALLASLSVLWALLRPFINPTAESTRAVGDVQVYKDQLSEIENELARGVISPDEARSSRTEISRRLLKAADFTPRTTNKPANTLALPLVISLAVLALSFGLYARLGSPGTPNQPLQPRLAALAAERANRPSQEQAQAAYAAQAGTTLPAPEPSDIALVEQLKTALAARPNDLRGHQLLVQSQAQIGLWADAGQSQQQVIRIKASAATGADYIALGEYMVLATGGFVSPQAEQALATGLTLDPSNPLGRYYSGLTLAQGGRPDLAYRLWTGLLTQGPADAPWISAINAMLPAIAQAAGQPLPELAGPDAAQIESAADMSETDRNAMIADMVSGLADRLQSQGGTAEEWAQLIRAYGVLGQTADANAAWATAKTTFAQDAAALALLQQAAQTAEITN